MDFKPSNFFVSLVSLLGVVLPGSILAFFALTGVWRPILPPALTAVQTGSPEGWAIFLIGAYIAGQALYSFGKWFLDPVYYRTYRRYQQWVAGNPKKLID